MLASHGPEMAAAASELTSACQPGKRKKGEAVREVRFSLKPLAYIHSLDGAVSLAHSEM